MTTTTVPPARSPRRRAAEPSGAAPRRPSETAARTAGDDHPALRRADAATRANADGIVGIYVARVLDRGGDLRAVAAEARQARFGTPDRLTAPSFVAARPVPIGRTADVRRPLPRLTAFPAAARPASRPAAVRRPHRRLVAAAVAVLLMLPFAAFVARATESPTTSGHAIGVEHAAGPPAEPGSPASTR